MKPAKLQRQDASISKAMMGYFSLFSTIADAQAFQDAVHKSDAKHLPPCVRAVRDGGTPTSIYWRWMAASAEAWS